MDKLKPETGDMPQESGPVDLAGRLARYRRRVEAEGRRRSLQIIDQAIADASGEPHERSAKLPNGSS